MEQPEQTQGHPALHRGVPENPPSSRGAGPARNPSLFLMAQGIALITPKALKRRISLMYLNFLEREAKGRFPGW